VLPYEAERDLMLRSADTLEKITGKRAVGLRTPSWDFSPNTLRIEKELGLAYDSSLMADEDCYELLHEGERPVSSTPCRVGTRRRGLALMMHRFSAPTLYAAHRLLSTSSPRAGRAWGRRHLPATCHHVIGYRSRV
jgi:peptidoglycan/xylan/chitin deacetylase (PgdA/CDA1 family)